MLLSFVSQILICVVVARFTGVALEALVFARWTLRESGKKFTAYYWMFFHAIAAYMVMQVLFRNCIEYYSLMNVVSFSVFAVGVYVLMFIMPPYRSKIAMGFQMIEELQAKKQDPSTMRLISFMQVRVSAGFGGLAVLIVLLFFRLFVPMTDFTQIGLDWLYTTATWLYWGIAAISAFLCVVSLIFGVQLMIASSKQRAARKELEKKMGRKLPYDEFAQLYMEQQESKKA